MRPAALARTGMRMSVLCFQGETESEGADDGGVAGSGGRRGGKRGRCRPRCERQSMALPASIRGAAVGSIATFALRCSAWIEKMARDGRNELVRERRAPRTPRTTTRVDWTGQPATSAFFPRSRWPACRGRAWSTLSSYAFCRPAGCTSTAGLRASRRSGCTACRPPPGRRVPLRASSRRRSAPPRDQQIATIIEDGSRAPGELHHAERSVRRLEQPVAQLAPTWRRWTTGRWSPRSRADRRADSTLTRPRAGEPGASRRLAPGPSSGEVVPSLWAAVTGFPAASRPATGRLRRNGEPGDQVDVKKRRVGPASSASSAPLYGQR